MLVTMESTILYSVDVLSQGPNTQGVNIDQHIALELLPPESMNSLTITTTKNAMCMYMYYYIY